MDFRGTKLSIRSREMAASTNLPPHKKVEPRGALGGLVS